MQVVGDTSKVEGRCQSFGDWAMTLLGVAVGLLVAEPALSAAQRSLTGDTSPYKGYSGFRLDGESTRLVYHHDQTIAVVEVNPERRMLNCELIEVYRDSVKKEALFNLTKIAKPYGISFSNMMDLMERCDQLSAPSNFKSNESGRSEEGRGSGSIFNGVLPGTKWCGAGDVAETYFDLGEEEIIDRCCRIHDLCPAKVRAYTTRYNLTNNSIYTKSHCQCDNIFHTCLKSTNHSTADVMGNIYFNILRVPCVEERNGGRRFKLPDPY